MDTLHGKKGGYDKLVATKEKLKIKVEVIGQDIELCKNKLATLQADLVVKQKAFLERKK